MSGEDATAAAFGWWPSPWSAARVAAGRISRSGLATAAAGRVTWCESRPGEDGRQVVVRTGPAGAPEDVSPEGTSVRSRVHEYGGASATLAGSTLFYVDQRDQRWYRFPVPGEGGVPGVGVPQPLTPEANGGTVRHADGRLTPSGRWLVCVEERVTRAGTRHALVAVATDGSERVLTLEQNSDFVASPRVSPDGSRLAWVSWNHPWMPWDRSALHVARLEESERAVVLAAVETPVAGERSSVGQPRWCRDGSLVFVDDHSGWWRPQRLSRGARDPVELVAVDAEFHAPDWVLGQSTIAELRDGTLLCRMRKEGRDALVHLRPGAAGPDAGGWTTEEVAQPCVTIGGLAASDDGRRIWVLGSTPEASQCVLELESASGGARCGVTQVAGLAPGGSGSTEELLPAAAVARSRPFVAGTPAGPIPGHLFLPGGSAGRVLADTGAESGGVPPLLVFCHGGPTGAAESGFDPVVQFFVSRGYAVALVDYRGSTGYGRAYRDRLVGQWGVADVEDCAAYARALADAGLVDGDRMAIRGTSAGGLTALGALVRTRLFRGAAAWYGVTDLRALAEETHDFESRYLDSLVGPWPEATTRFVERSPVHHADRIEGEVLLLQGADDPVVPPDQAVGFAEALRAHGVACRLRVFEGESHGFRSAATIEAALTEELDFYRSLFGR